MQLSGFMPSREGRIAIFFFLLSVATFLAMVVGEVDWWAIPLAEGVAYFIMILIIDVKVVQLIFIVHSLGLCFSVGAWMAVSGGPYSSFGPYMAAISFFHWSEYVTTAMYNPHTLSFDSFLINHSWEYGVAAITSWLEFWGEYYFFPGLKGIRLFFWVGLAMVVLGETLRKVAMFTAASNFTHIVQLVKRSNHTLVTTGVYSIFRHPSYVGWFYWSIGTQVMLCNPVCTVAYAIVTWLFFNGRIEEEEELLHHFFGEEYTQYKEKVGIGIPFIRGFKHKTS